MPGPDAVPIDVSQLALWESKPWFAAFDNFCGVNIPASANFKLLL